MAVDPSTRNLTIFHQNYAGSPWTGAASAGVSGTTVFSQAAAPAVGASLNGHPTADFNGTTTFFNSSLNAAQVLGGGGWFVDIVAFVDSLYTGSEFDQPFTRPGFLTANAFWGIHISSWGFEWFQYTSGGAFTKGGRMVSPTVGAWHHFQVRWNGTHIQCRFRVAGGVETPWSTAVAITSISASMGTFRVGQNNGSNRFIDGPVAHFIVESGVVDDATADEYGRYAQDRYALDFAYEDVDPTLPVAGSTSVSFANTGAVQGRGAIVGGASGLTFDSTGTLKGRVGAAGTTSVAFDSTGALKGRAAVAGTSPLLFDVTGGPLKGRGAVSGTAPLLFDAAGAPIKGRGALAGTTDVEFDTSGAVKGRADVDGTTTLAFANTGALKGVGQVEGEATLAFTNQATLRAERRASGTTSVSFESTATVKGLGEVSGTTSLAFTNTGFLKSKVPVEGSSTFSFTNAGSVKGLGDVEGSASLTFESTATLTRRGTIAGSSSIAFASNGALKGRGGVAGQVVSPTFTNAGLVKGRGAVGGTSAFTLTPTLDLKGRGAIGGTTSISFTSGGDLFPPGSLWGSTSISFTSTGSLKGLGHVVGASNFSWSSFANILAKEIPFRGPFERTLEGSFTGATTILKATGPGPDLFHNIRDGWLTNRNRATVFNSVMDAQRTPILGLPPGYRPVLMQAIIPGPESPT